MKVKTFIDSQGQGKEGGGGKIYKKKKKEKNVINMFCMGGVVHLIPAATQVKAEAESGTKASLPYVAIRVFQSLR